MTPKQILTEARRVRAEIIAEFEADYKAAAKKYGYSQTFGHYVATGKKGLNLEKCLELAVRVRA